MTTDSLVSSSNNSPDTYRKTRPERIDIGEGLVMRWSTRADQHNVASCMAEAFRWVQFGRSYKEDEYPEPNKNVYKAMSRLLSGHCKVMTEYDYALVENTLAKEGENPIVACVCLQASPGYYGKVQLTYGKPECVGSHPDYRNRGLIRRLFLEMIHPASEARGDVIQMLPGIPHFYLQFGYEYAMAFRPFRQLKDVAAAIPLLPEHETEEPFLLREPILDDLPYLIQMSTPEKLMENTDIGLYYDETYWRYTVFEAAEVNHDLSRYTRIIVDAKTGKDCGLIMGKKASYYHINIFTLEDSYHHRYRDALYPVLRQFLTVMRDAFELQEKKEKEELEKEKKDNSQEQEKDKGNCKEKEEEHGPVVTKNKIPSFFCNIDAQHPVSKLLESKLVADKSPMRIYTRIPSYANFILKVAPTLEDRLAKSYLAGISVTWHFDFFRKVLGTTGKGLEIVFENGKIISASDDWVPPSPHAMMLAARERIRKEKEDKEAGRSTSNQQKPLEFKGAFAPLSLTRLLVGDLNVDELQNTYGEFSLSGGDEAHMMLDILFPKQQYHLDMFWW
ncbi:hypothetical protein BGX28_003951 [Mortierella sp. GBA30]|nr:hypothetical protein BGX28_003951 [Mortierella sp. GBA30]